MQEQPNVLVIVSDTFRRDNLVAYGGDPRTAPNLDGLAAEGLVFDHFYAASFPTVPARADLLTGKVSFTRHGWLPLPEDWPTMAEIAGGAGYQTMGVTDVPFLLRDGFGYDRGFDDYIWIRGQTNPSHRESVIDVMQTWRGESDRFAARTMSAAADWLERQVERGSRPFLLVADTWDPHEPWDPPAHYIRRHLPEYEGGEVPYPVYNAMSDANVTEDELRLVEAGYRGKASMVDFWIGHLLRRLEALGLAESTAVLFLTDHGFYFGEHDYLGKAVAATADPTRRKRGIDGREIARSPLYEEVAHIPLLMRIPGAKPGRVQGVANMPDVTATVLSLIGAEAPADFGGRPLLDGTHEKGRTRREIAVTSWAMHLPGDETRSIDHATRKFKMFMPMTVSTPEWSLLYSSESDPVELFDLVKDPNQRHDVSARHPDVVRDLHGKLVRYLEEAQCPPEYLAPRRSVMV